VLTAAVANSPTTGLLVPFPGTTLTPTSLLRLDDTVVVVQLDVNRVAVDCFG